MISQSEMVLVLEIANAGLSMYFDEIAEELGLSDDQLQHIRDAIQTTLRRGNGNG